MLRGGVPDGYTSQDWAIDFSRWVVAVAGSEVLGWLEAHAVDKYSEKDVADLVGRSEAQVRWEFRRLRQTWKGIRKSA